MILQGRCAAAVSGRMAGRRHDASGRMLAGICLVLSLLLSLSSGQAAGAQVISIAYISQEAEALPRISNLDLPPEDGGVAGGLLSIADNNTTGRFLNQEFRLEAVSVPPDGEFLAAFEALLAQDFQLIILNVPAEALLAAADASRDRDVLLFNAGAADDRLRNGDCRNNVMHIAPSRAMLAYSLGQYLAARRWHDWFLVVGRREGDQKFAAALRRAAKRFGAEIVEERSWDYGPDARRTAQSVVPVFTQGVDYDVLIVADEIGEFGEYLAYRTWEPRPVAGTQGLVPTSWHRTHEQWGAAQLQSRFLKQFGRHMTPLDYQVWAPIRAIGEGATRGASPDFAGIRDYLRRPDFELAGFKGQKLTFRGWNWQLRQPVLLAGARALVSVSPQEGFLHPGSLLDTLGWDESESACRLTP